MISLKIIKKKKDIDTNTVIIEGINNLEIVEKELYVFINVVHLYKDKNNLLKSGFLLVSILMCTIYDNSDCRDYNVLELNSDDIEEYYNFNYENNNILFETIKKNSKFSIKFVYLKNSNHLNSHFKWVVFPYILDKKVYINDLYYNDVSNTKVDLFYRYHLKHRISYNIIFKNVLNYVKKGLFLREK